MPPRLRLQPKQLRSAISGSQYICRQCRHASVEAAPTPAAPTQQTIRAVPPISRHPSTQPPSHKPPEFRKSQLHRQYQSLLRSSPLMLIFQHNNLKASEWAAVRRELTVALRKVDEELAKNGNREEVGTHTRLQVIQTGIFASALRVVEFWNPNFETNAPATHATHPHTVSSTELADTKPTPNDSNLIHGLSTEAWKVSRKNAQLKHGLEPLLCGPLAILSLPAVSPQHLKAALSILSPSPAFPAPKRKASPSLYELPVQNGLQKFMFLGARVEGQAFDTEGAKWVGGIEGGLDGLRGQLVTMLQGVSAGVTNTLEAASRSLYVTVDTRKGMLEEEGKGQA